MPVAADVTFEVSHRGSVPESVIERATEKVTHAAERAREPVRHIEIRLAEEPNPARARPAIAEATIDVDGRPVRAQVAASTMDEAVDLLVDRLRRRLQRHEERRHRLPDRHRTGDSGEGEWRHGDLPGNEPEILDVPFDEREVRRQKSLAPAPMSVEEAVWDLEQLGHEFFLFTDVVTGSDCIVRRRSDGRLELIGMDPDGLEPEPDGVSSLEADPVVMSEHPPPELGLPEAKEQLEASGARFLFHGSGSPPRGRVLYRRYDGHYGLVTVG